MHGVRGAVPRERLGWHLADGIFDYHHYHATAHEVLGCAQGWVQVRLGGPNGREARLNAGDVVLLPAGTAHRNLGHSADYRIVGGIPRASTRT